MPPPGQLSNTILHHPGTFDSCLEVDIADDYHKIIRSIRLIRIIRMMIPWHLGNFNSDQIFKSNQCRVSPTRFLQVSSPTLKGKHCLLTSFVKGAGIMQGVFSFVRLLLDILNHVTWETIILVLHGLHKFKVLKRCQRRRWRCWSLGETSIAPSCQHQASHQLELAREKRGRTRQINLQIQMKYVWKSLKRLYLWND